MSPTFDPDSDKRNTTNRSTNHSCSNTSNNNMDYNRNIEQVRASGCELTDGALRQDIIELTRDAVRHVLLKSAPRSKQSVTASFTRWSTKEHAATMRRVMDDIMTRYSITFDGIVRRLRLGKVDNMDDITRSFQHVVAEMDSDGERNWGRLVTVFAFAARLIQHCVQNDVIAADQPEVVDSVACSLGNHIADRLGCWIADNGGWDEFERFFAPPQSDENLFVRGLVTAAAVLGVGAIAAIVAR